MGKLAVKLFFKMNGANTTQTKKNQTKKQSAKKLMKFTQK
jgi:hypothetical protein